MMALMLGRAGKSRLIYKLLELVVTNGKGYMGHKGNFKGRWKWALRLGRFTIGKGSPQRECTLLVDVGCERAVGRDEVGRRDLELRMDE